MIAACPRCQTRYRVKPEQLGADGARLRCSRCSAVFRVRLPQARPDSAPAPSEPGAARPPVEEAVPPPPRAVAQAAPPPAVAPEPPPDRERLVLVAHAEPELCKRVADALERRGLRVLVACDGVEAILAIQRALPRAVVLDAALPKMFGFQVCELLKRNESLRAIGVVLVGAVYKEERYRRPPHDLYGADVYVEPHELPDALYAGLARLGVPIAGEESVAHAPPRAGGRPPAAAVSAVAAAPPAAARAPAAASDPALAAEQAKAERLARIIVSDIVLYNPAKFEAALEGGDVVEALREELEEGRTLFRARVGERVRGSRDFLVEELARVAAARRGR
jgi:predicted Zn finger-like uncharacterized protein